MNNKIKVLIVDDHKLFTQGLACMLADVAEIGIVGFETDIDTLLTKIPVYEPHIVLLNIHNVHEFDFTLLKKISEKHKKTSLVLHSVLVDEKLIINALRSGAKGILTRDTDRLQLIEAILTIRNGFDYFSQSISDLVLQKYCDATNYEEKQLTNRMLTNRELEILKLVGEGVSNQKIADKLFISIRTVEAHKNNIMRKLKLKSSVDMVKYAIRNNLAIL